MNRTPEDTYTSTNTPVGQKDPEAGPVVPVLIVIGDAAALAENRAVVRIDRSLEIGRGRSGGGPGHLVLDDGRVSRTHARITFDPKAGRAELTDLGSRNGTVVDGAPLWGTAAALQPGALIFIGGHAAVFRRAREAELAAIARDLDDPFAAVATTSPALAAQNQALRGLAKTNEDLLIVGDTGVGKEQYARAIHRASGRWGKFVAIDCPTLPASLVESELFGFVRGAHSQADRNKLGQIEEAEHGTLFLDEFAELSNEIQAKFLRFLENREFVALGSTKRRSIDVRVVAATNRSLRALRRDLAARLGPQPIGLPSLGARREDLAALAAHFLRQHPGLAFELPAFQALCLHPWPDNIRQLKKTVERAAGLAAAEGKRLIQKNHLGLEGPESTAAQADDESRKTPASDTDAPDVAPRPGARRSPRPPPGKMELEALLRRHDWVVTQAARELDRDHAVVWRWIRRYGMLVPRGRV